MTQLTRFLGKIMICALAVITPIFVLRSYHDQKELAKKKQQLNSAVSSERRELALRVVEKILEENLAGSPSRLHRNLISGEIHGLHPFVDRMEFFSMANVRIDGKRRLSGRSAELLWASSEFFSGLPKSYAGLVECLSSGLVDCNPEDGERLYQVAQDLFLAKSINADQFGLLVAKLPSRLRDAYALPLFFLIGKGPVPESRVWSRVTQGETMRLVPLASGTVKRINRSIKALNLDAVFKVGPEWLKLGEISANLKLVPGRGSQTFTRLNWIYASLFLVIELILFLIFGTLMKYERQSQKEKTFLAAGTHELRTPLAVIRQFSEMLLDRSGLFDPKIQKYHRFIHRECMRMQFLVENLLSQARMERVRTELNCEWFDLNSLLDEIVRSLEPVYDHHIQWYCPEIKVFWDRMYMSQVIINLLENARRHGKSEVQIMVCEMGGDMEISVRDFGTDMDEQVLAKIIGFRNHSKKAKGLGLGLFLCRTIVKAHGGSLEFSLGQPGLLVRIRIPREARKSVLKWRATSVGGRV